MLDPRRVRPAPPRPDEVNDWRLAVDIGGTFTDVVLLDAAGERVAVDKTLTTNPPLGGVRRGVEQLLAKVGVAPPQITRPIVHATTLITNALIEGKTGRAALVTTRGFGDTLLIRDEHRYDMYDLQIEFPEPPIPRSLTFEIEERTNARGATIIEPTPDQLAVLATSLSGVEAVAICLLNSYVNPGNERLIASYLAEKTGLPISTSSEVSPQIREYPRMITTACNAATIPVIGPYLDELQKWLAGEGFGGSVLMMLSNGGVVSAGDAARFPIRSVESGPAAGALAAAWYANRMSEDRLLAFDMGGTTAKACFIENGEPQLTNTFEVARIYRFKKGSGFPVSVPSVDLVEIGAGGGSLARIDQFGLLKVGPESAGAEPGPASYGRGGTEPTVTDADAVLGLIDPAAFLGGDMPLDGALATSSLEQLAQALRLSVVDTAAGIHEIVNENMAAATRMHAVEQGVDLRGVSILAFGGAGPVHACGVAELLEAPRVIFPVNASVLSAFGTLVSPVRIDLARSMPGPLAGVDPTARDALLDDLRTEGMRVLSGAGIHPDQVRFRYGLDARYFGQGNEVTVWVGEGDTWPAGAEEVITAFEAEYQRIYGLTIPDVAVEAVTWRLSAYTPADPFQPGTLAAAGDPAPASHRKVVFKRGTAPQEVAVYHRTQLPAGAAIKGPAIVEERETTVVITPGWEAVVAADGSVIATRWGV